MIVDALCARGETGARGDVSGRVALTAHAAHGIGKSGTLDRIITERAHLRSAGAPATTAPRKIPAVRNNAADMFASHVTPVQCKHLFL